MNTEPDDEHSDEPFVPEYPLVAEIIHDIQSNPASGRVLVVDKQEKIMKLGMDQLLRLAEQGFEIHFIEDSRRAKSIIRACHEEAFGGNAIVRGVKIVHLPLDCHLGYQRRRIQTRERHRSDDKR